MVSLAIDQKEMLCQSILFILVCFYRRIVKHIFKTIKMNENFIFDDLQLNELLEVKGGADPGNLTCIFSVAIKCTVAGSGVIIDQPTEPDKGTQDKGGSGIIKP